MVCRTLWKFEAVSPTEQDQLLRAVFSFAYGLFRSCFLEFVFFVAFSIGLGRIVWTVVCWSSIMRCSGIRVVLLFGLLQEPSTQIASESSKSIQVQLEKLRKEAASGGREWLSGCLEETRANDLRKLALAAGIEAKSNGRRLTSQQLKAALLEAILPTEQKRISWVVFDVVCWCCDACFGVFVCFCFSRMV